MPHRREPFSQSFITVISDTHGLLRPEVLQAVTGADMIIHAGDIGKPEILQVLESIAPLVAVRGNNDTGPWAMALALTTVVPFAHHQIYVLHDLHDLDLDLDPAAAGFAAVICGHSHRPRLERRGGVLFLNPGSAGPRRFTLPVAVARMYLRDGVLAAELIELVV